VEGFIINLVMHKKVDRIILFISHVSSYEIPKSNELQVID